MRPLLLACVLLLGGCGWFGWFGKSDEQLLLETGASAPAAIPEGLDRPPFVDQMPIPEVVDYRGLTGQTVELGLPDPLSTTFGVEQIVIRRLGDEQWVFIDSPTATIWPQVALFWEENELPVAELDPRNGVLETEWMTGAGDNPDEIFESLGAAAPDGPATRQFRFRVRVEPGVRTSSTELYVETRERSSAGLESAAPDWGGGSDNSELESKVLSTIAYYLSERVAQGSGVSLLAAGLQESKADLVAEPGGMVLKYKLNFDRAWATVGAALEDANVSVEDLDRTAAVYYVYYTSRHDPNPGFIARLFGADRNDGERDADLGHRFRVQLEPRGEEVHVTVGLESELADTRSLILRERLLKLIKEYST